MTLNFESCSFAGNQAIEGIDGWGGGVHFEDFNTAFNNCYFIGNTAKNGGGLYLSHGEVTLVGGAINENKAIGGSGIDTNAYRTSSFGFMEPIDISLGLDFGGGIVLARARTTIEDCTLADNVVEGINGSGGAVSFFGGEAHLVRNCLLTGNTATVRGGAISSSYFATPNIKNCTFSGNNAGSLGGAIFCDWSSDPNIVDCIFESCNSQAIYEDVLSNAIVRYSLFHNNRDGDYGSNDPCAGILTGPQLDANNIAGNPLFEAGLLGNFYLNQGASPAVDNGSDSAANLGLDTYTTDPNGGLDTVQVDIGYHYHDPLTLPQFTLTVNVTDPPDFH
ncbi:MAG: right-handed parallel beta-helix repeat-containing protein [Planctomycetota bacterium]